MARNLSMRAAILYPGTPAMRQAPDPEQSRFWPLFTALANAGLRVEPAIYNDDCCEDVRAQLLQLDGVLVWVNPIHEGRDRTVLDAMLRDVAAAGIFVSAHPDVILALGTKEVLYQTRAIGWSGDVHLYRSAEQMRLELPGRLAAGQARVLKRNRGNGGQGVWKVQVCEARADGRARPLRSLDAFVCVRQATRGAVDEELTLAAFVERCDPYFAAGGLVIDQAFEERLPEGMVRCYLVHDHVAGFGVQAVNALCPAPPGAASSAAPAPTPRRYHPATMAAFQTLKRRLEQDWVPAMQSLLGIARERLPVLWDCDFLFGERTAAGDDTFVLCEINVSSVAPFPESAIPRVVEATTAQLSAARAKRRR